MFRLDPPDYLKLCVSHNIAWALNALLDNTYLSEVYIVNLCLHNLGCFSFVHIVANWFATNVGFANGQFSGYSLETQMEANEIQGPT